MGEREQVKPLAPATVRSDEDPETKLESPRKLQKPRCILLCGCCAATFLILAVVILVLALTIFKVKDPEMKLNSITLDGLSFVSGQGWLGGAHPSFNMNVTADISIKNPNVASFEFHNSTSIVSYRDEMIGEAYIPAGKASGKRTLRMKVTIDVMVAKLMKEMQLYQDLLKGSVQISSYTKMAGRINLLNIFKHQEEVMMNCTMTLSVGSREIKDQSCKRGVKL